MLTTFCDNVNVESVRVYPPKRYVLLCGGEVSSIHEPKPISLRDAFLRGGAITALNNSRLLQIEDILEFFDKDSPYVDLVKFESDIAQVCELVLLFSESPGSFTELGSFAMLSSISEKLLLVVQSKYLSKSSFITKVPVASLKRAYPNSVFSFADATVGIMDGAVSTVNEKTLVAIVAPSIKQRLKQTEDRTTLDTTKFNHLCKLYVGLLRESYCLKDEEIILLFNEFGANIDVEVLNRIAFCCCALRWASSVTSGFDRVHFAMRALPVHKNATAYKEGSSIRCNAEAHVHNRAILKYDFRDFFPSITEMAWIAYCEGSSLFNRRDSIIAGRLLFRRQRGGRVLRLSIGAPSSPVLSNVLMYNFDTEVSRRVSEHKITYTRYADDMTFSAERTWNLREVDSILRSIISKMTFPRLVINDKKTTLVTPKYHRQITGLVLTLDGKMSLGRDRKRNIRAAIHHFAQGKTDRKAEVSLAGMLAFAKDVEPEFYERMESAYGKDVMERLKYTVTGYKRSR